MRTSSTTASGPIRSTATTWAWSLFEVAGLPYDRWIYTTRWTMATLSDRRTVVGKPMAFVVDATGIQYYRYGDTCIFDMRLIGGAVFHPTDLVLLGCTLHGRTIASDTRPRQIRHLGDGSGPAASCGGDTRLRTRGCLSL